MVHKNIPVSPNTKEILNQYYYRLKAEKKIKNWDDFILLLFESYKVEVKNEK